MNKLFITLLFTFMIIAASAQTGLFNAKFGDTKQASIDNMINEGFEISTNDTNEVVMIPTDNYLIDSVTLNFSPDEDALIGWSVAYIPQDEDDIESIALEAVESWHGEDYVWDDNMEEYIWPLGEDKYVYAYYDYYYDFFFVQYTSGQKSDVSDDEEEYWDY